MDESKSLDRREFTLAAALAMLSGVAITVSSACGSDYGGSPSPAGGDSGGSSGGSTSGSSDETGVVSNNHGHRAVITSAQLVAGGALQLDIRGDASHTHTVSLSADDMSAISVNQRVTKLSTTDVGHDHSVTFN